ncbi:hypothetical protein SIAM614_21405 [Stappia aggregata IAM 12614]|uniref:DUF3800 domain-containing protein n=1 Tax=Roseibium aggregatum (strain ATCC 25650 / DSM 13394 / JCM 20685 / NBRC 16684 / NCIMB 2208 / IAM 12614 / B1) TaxID=384765 RepID=A0P3I1_ROSAI|nr:DUF3800 domain-containing protein [Roseibium aggregatum]EAV40429.1 hypothetical protein SIAM614_21405 [Stappia aggregata IAM 12614] [Roseibium aggregatum IAM 12614]
MAYFFLDDSKHHTRGFSLAAFAICETDPQAELTSVLRENGFDPSVYEFKSSAPIKDNPGQQRLRNHLKWFIRRNCKIAVCVVEGDRNIGPASLRLLQKAIAHKRFKGQRHEVYFDQGLFSSRQTAQRIASECVGLEKCSFNFEQDSRSVAGIQVADLVAHLCGTLLLDALGHIDKKVKIKNSGYPQDLDIELGFELWADLRYEFLSVAKPNPDDEFDMSVVAVEPHGLFIHESVSEPVAEAARKRFGEMYLGCIH